MWARWLADVVVLAHFAFVVFVVLGGFWIVRRQRQGPALRRPLLWLHPPCAMWGALIEARGWICPLTYLENYFRRQAGQLGYSEGFVEHYLIPVLYPAALDRQLQLLLAVLVVAVNAIAYGRAFIRWRTAAGRAQVRTPRKR